MQKSIIKERSYEFALMIIRLYLDLKDAKHFELAAQILRSGTSIGANIEEALAGQSRKDFLAKMSIASKEARETNYWLRLLQDSKLMEEKKIKPLINESVELIKILTKIVKTVQEK